METNEQVERELVFGAKDIAKIVFGENEPTPKQIRQIYYWSQKGALPGVEKMGHKTLRMSVPVYRREMHGELAK